MQCSVCHKLQATIHILDLEAGSVSEQQSLCSNCAENAGFVPPKATPLKISPEMLEDLLGSMQSTVSGTAAAATTPASPTTELDATCSACGMSASQFRSRGRLGCPRCYETFRKSLVPLLERVHDATSHKGRCPGQPARMAEVDDKLADLRHRLRAAIQSENYELAADLRDQIRFMSGDPDADGSQN